MVAGEKACSGVVARDPDLSRWFSNIAPAVDDPLRAAALAPAVRNSLPDWLHERLAAQWSGEALEALESSLLAPAPLDLRVNLLKADVPAAIAALAAEDIAATAIEKVPGALRLTGHPALEHSKTFLDGWVEVQDAGSQWLVACVGAKRGETIVDFCAGAGGKTLALAAAMRGGGQVFAIDVSEGRLAKLRPRLLRAGATNVQPMRIESEADPKLSRLSKRADRVLVDAPCSGTGTLRRNPDLKWRQSLRDVAELTVRQGAILAAAAQLVKPGGRLVYATCSLLEAENDGVARAFAEKHPDFMAVDADPGGAGLATGFPGARTLLPHLEGCDGFYAVAFQRLKPSAV
jgi:16S rRNA (cytosine967-C5)-methyltransferase